MADESIWQGVPYVQDGDPVRASVTNAPTQVLAERTTALKTILDAIEAGNQLQLRSAPLAAGILVGQVVYFKASTLVHEKSAAKWLSVDDQQVEATPAPEAVYSGIVISKTSDRTGDILINGYHQLDATGLTNLFGTATPDRGFYYLSMLTAGTVQSTSPAMRVRVLQYMGDGVLQVYPPSSEPVTHTHRDYRLHDTAWLLASSIPGAPAGATYGYNFAAVDSQEQFLGECLLPTVGKPSFRWLYHDDASSSSSSSSTDSYDQGGLHVDETLIVLDGNGIWWFGYAPPDSDMSMELVSADVKGLSFISAIANATPSSIRITSSNGVVTIGLRQWDAIADATDTHIVVKHVDPVNGKEYTGPVVSKLLSGSGITMSSPEGDGRGKVTIELTQWHDMLIDASIQNLNNSITSVEDPHVIVLFPNSRTSQVTCRAVLPNLGTTSFKAKIFANFLSPGPSQAPPTISNAVLVPTPTAAGVTPAAPVATTFPNIPSSVLAGNIYLVESVAEFNLDGYSRGIFSYTLEAITPSPELRMINTGIRLYLNP